jgi:hypothetical protein
MCMLETHSTQVSARPRVPAPPAARRTLQSANLVASFYTSEPEPSQWIAVATIARLESDDPAHATLRLLVGSGDSEAAAVEQLSQRLHDVSA